MSLIIKNLTKVYGQQKAVDNISFEVKEGEIVGFLGPNGAGKSTTFKIATSYIPPTEGSVTLCDHDVVENPLAVKKMLGYLPEHNPLYTDMFVHEYLSFAGRLYGLSGRQLTVRIGAIVEQCGLEREQNKKIETLSKGYRQRVGLAQALIHNPKVLILDEPTSGLDPNQLVEIRKVVKDISHDKTVIFSSHIMQEVQALCDRVIMINRGKLVADDSLTNILSRKNFQQAIIVEFGQDVSSEALRGLDHVEDVTAISPRVFKITSTGNRDIRTAIFKFASDNHVAMVGLRQEESSLEAVFQELTR